VSPWFPRAVLLAGIVGMIVVRAPHIKRSTGIKVVKSGNTGLDGLFVAFVSVALLLPLLWMATSVLGFADYALHPIALGAGAVCVHGSDEAPDPWCLVAHS
jgi:hypothetical protein